MIFNPNCAQNRHYLTCLIILSLTIACRNIEPPLHNQSEGPKGLSKYQDSIQDNVFLNVKGFFVRDSFTLYRLFSGATILTDGLQTPLYVDDDFSSNQVIEDFNGDGFDDIRFEYLAPVPGVDRLLLYCQDESKFMEVENFPNFASAKRISRFNCYFSYSKAGCADSDWISKLFIIDDFHCVELGRIYGSGCKGNSWNGIVIHKTMNVPKVLIDSIPRPPGYYQDKFEFIETYWNENADKFVN